MTNPLPRFDFWPCDWLASARTRRMTLAERGLYIDLLAFQWREGSVPNDVAQVARLVGSERAETEAAWAVVRSGFDIGADGQLRNARLERERSKALHRHAEAVEKGRLGGLARVAQAEGHLQGKLRASNQQSTVSNQQSDLELPVQARATPPQPRKTGGAWPEFADWWTVAYLEAKGIPYSFEGAKDGRHCKTLKERCKSDLAMATVPASRLLADPFFAETGVSISVLVSQWNKLQSAGHHKNNSASKNRIDPTTIYTNES